MTIDDTYIISAGVTVWGATASIVAVLWNRIRTLENKVAKLQAEKAEGDAAKVMIDSCPHPTCPYGVAALMLCLCLSGCAPKTPEVFDKRIKIVIEHRQPPGSAVSGIAESLLKLIPF